MTIGSLLEKIPQELRKRVITAAALFLVFFGCVAVSAFAPGFTRVFLVLGFLFTAAAAWEFSRMSAAVPADPLKRFVYLLLTALPGALALWVYFSIDLRDRDLMLRFAFLVPAITAAISVFFAVWFMAIRSRSSMQHAEEISQDIFLAVFFIGFCGACLMTLGVFPGAGRNLIWFLLVVCVNDIAAYFGGRHFEGPKLAPVLSPGKTISGSICGFGGGAVAGLLLFWLVEAIETPLDAIALALAVTGAAQLGDLAKSYFKRLHDVKDSGSLLPGHGGVLDRLDGIMFSAPVMLAFLVFKALSS